VRRGPHKFLVQCRLTNVFVFDSFRLYNLTCIKPLKAQVNRHTMHIFDYIIWTINAWFQIIKSKNIKIVDGGFVNKVIMFHACFMCCSTSLTGWTRVQTSLTIGTTNDCLLSINSHLFFTIFNSNSHFLLFILFFF